MDASTIRKALDLASSGSYFIPEVIDGAIRDFISEEPVLYNVVRKQPWATNTYMIRKLTGVPTATWSTDGAPLPAASQASWERVTKTVKYLYTRGEVTGPLQAATGNLFDALQTEIEENSKAIVRQLSASIATGTGGVSDIEGILQQATAGSDDSNAGNATLDVTGEGALTLNMLDRAIDNTRGEANIAVTSRKVRRAVASLLQSQQQFVNTSELRAGFRVPSYDGVAFVTDYNWELDDTIVFFNTSDARLLVNKDFTYEELAKTKDSVDFMIKGYFGFALEGRPTVLTGFSMPSGVL